METNHETSGCSGTVSEQESQAEKTVEIKIKTLDSQSYTVRVGKDVPIPALKDQLASVVGVPAYNQRLICQGKVLKDDHLLSAYSVENGDTLHLVDRQPPSTSGMRSTTVSPEGGEGDVGLPLSESTSGHFSHSLVMGTISIPDNGEGELPDFNQIISAVISSIGMRGDVSLQSSTGNSNTVSMGVLPTSALVETGIAEGRTDYGDEDTGVRELELQINALYGMPFRANEANLPSSIRSGQAPVVLPDALTTMSQYLDRLEQSFAAQESERLPSFQSTGPAEGRVGPEVGATETRVQASSPAALGATLNRVNHLLEGQANSTLSNLARQLENETTMFDLAAREDVQHTAYHDGNLIQQTGVLLLELGRAILSLRMGQLPGESVVNSGPAIFISPTGPNPMVVQSNAESQLSQSTNTDVSHAEAEVRPTPEVQASRSLPDGGSLELAVQAMQDIVTNLETDVPSGGTAREGPTAQPTSQDEGLEVGQSGDTSSRSLTEPVLGPVGLGLAGFQPLPARGRRRRLSQRIMEVDQNQAGQTILQSLLAQRNQVDNTVSQNRNDSPMPVAGSFVRADGVGGDRWEEGPNFISQLMHSPVMGNLVQQVMQGIGNVDVGDGTRLGPAAGAFDLLGLLQHVMPVVTQMLSGGPTSGHPRNTTGTSSSLTTDDAAMETTAQPSESERWQDVLTQEEVSGWSETIASDEEVQQSMLPQRPLSDAYCRGTHAANRKKTEVETAAEKLENGGSAVNVLQDLAVAAGTEVLGSNGTTSNENLSLQVVQQNGLAEAYLVVLFNDLAARVAADSDFGDGSHFPHAARFFQQPFQSPTEPDGV